MGTIVTGPVFRTGGPGDFVDPVRLSGSSPTVGAAPLSLVGQSPFLALRDLARLNATGLVGILGKEKLAFRLRDGRIVRAGTDRESIDEGLLREVARQRSVSRPDLEAAVEYCETEGAKLGRTLHKRGLLAAPELLGLLEAVFVECVHRAVAQENAQLVFASSDFLCFGRTPDALQVDLGRVLVTIARAELRDMYFDDLLPVLAPATGYFVGTKAQEVGELNLTKRELHAIERVLTGGYRLEEVLRLCALSRGQTARLLVLMHVFSALQLFEEPQTDRDDLGGSPDEVLARLRSADPFARLRAHWSSSTDDLRRGYDTVRRDLSHQGLWSQAGPYVEEAWSRVQTAEGRKVARLALVEPDQLLRAAALLSSQARAAEYRNERALAKRLFNIAHELNEHGGQPAS